MNIKLVYISPNGTTRKVTDLLKEELEKNGNIVETIDIGSSVYREDFRWVLEKLDDADLVGFGSPAYHMDMLEPMGRLLKMILSSKGEYHFKAVLYLTYGGITSGKAFLNAADMLNEKGIPVLGGVKVMAPHFHHKESFPGEGTRECIEEFCRRLREKDFAPIPGSRLVQVFAPRNRRVGIIYPFIHLIGKRRELKISIDNEKCKCCRKCERECPAGAINVNHSACIDFSKCIHCYHCTAACKFNGIQAPVEKLDDMIKLNKKVIGTEKPLNEMYF